jgi:hypothetical protein
MDRRPDLMNIKAEDNEVREQVSAISRKPGLLIKERETLAVMKVSEQALYSFPEEEPDLYHVNDIRAASG